MKYNLQIVISEAVLPNNYKGCYIPAHNDKIDNKFFISTPFIRISTCTYI